MSEAEPRRILIGTFPAGYSHTAVPDGAVEAAVRAANAALDLQQERRRRQAEAQRADLLRLQNTRSAKFARRFKRALAALGSRAKR